MPYTCQGCGQNYMYLYDDTKCLLCRAELRYWEPQGHQGNPNDNIRDWIDGVGVAHYDERGKRIDQRDLLDPRRRVSHPYDNERELRSSRRYPRR
jgi:hypothetical protein